MTLPPDAPKYIFEGTNATTSQRATRATLEHWEGLRVRGEVVVVGADATRIKQQHLVSSVGEGFGFRVEGLGFRV